MAAGYFGFLPDANFCRCASIQASINLRMPVSAHSSPAFSSLSISALILAISAGESMARPHAGLVRKYDIQQFSSN